MSLAITEEKRALALFAQENARSYAVCAMAPHPVMDRQMCQDLAAKHYATARALLHVEEQRP